MNCIPRLTLARDRTPLVGAPVYECRRLLWTIPALCRVSGITKGQDALLRACPSVLRSEMSADGAGCRLDEVDAQLAAFQLRARHLQCGQGPRQDDIALVIPYLHHELIACLQQVYLVFAGERQRHS